MTDGSSGDGGSGGDDGVAGHFGLPDALTDFNRHDFHIDQKTQRMGSVMPVKIIKVHGGGVGPAPTVDVQPLVKMVDGEGKAQSHGTIYGIQTHRSQGGNNVVINDPAVGDVGHIVIPHRDISGVLSGGDEANPGSSRKFDLSDGIYHGSLGLKNQKQDSTPKQYVYFTKDGITIMDKNNFSIVTTGSGMTLTASKINLVGEVHLGSTGGVPASMQGTIDSAGHSEVSNLATKVFVT